MPEIDDGENDKRSLDLHGMHGDALERTHDAGVDRVVFWVPTEGRDKVLPLLDKGAALIQP